MKKETYLTIEWNSMYEIPKIKWSRFICYLFPCNDKDQAESWLINIKKNHFSATHHCYARRLWTKIREDLFWNTLIEPESYKYNDDWEPTNTAWKPILTVLEWEHLHNIAAIVVRYFWWTLLGVWWLIQAYTQATKEAITHSKIIEKELLEKVELVHDYDQTALVTHLIKKYDIKLISEICEEKTKKILVINKWVLSDFNKELQESSNWTLKLN